MSDDRESPGRRSSEAVFRSALRRSGVVDPLAGQERIRTSGFESIGGQRIELARFAVRAVLTDLDVVDYETIADSVPLVLVSYVRKAHLRCCIDRTDVVVLW